MKKVNLWKTDDWWVSHYNYNEEVLRDLIIPERVEVHDTTLRDGEQQAGIVFRKDEKIEIAKMLDEAGVDRIEAGMPRVSKEDAEAVKAIANEGLSAKVFCLSRCMKKDVDLALSCDVDGIQIEMPSNDWLIKNAYGWDIKKAERLVVEATSYAGDHGLYTSYFTMDLTRAPFESCWRLIDACATEGHMDACTVVDTFGVCSPHAISYLVKQLKSRIRQPLEVHMHNDFGLAVANSIMGVLAGAETVHTTVNSIGERVGNASLEELVVALRLLYGIKTNIKIETLRPLSKLVQSLSNIKMPPQKPIVGDGIFTIESGIVASWWHRLAKSGMQHRSFPFRPEFVGHENEQIVLGKKSGKKSIIHWLEKIDMEIQPEKLEELLVKVKQSGEKKGGILTEEEFTNLIKEVADTEG